MDYMGIVYYFPDKRMEFVDQTLEEIKKHKIIYAAVLSFKKHKVVKVKNSNRLVKITEWNLHCIQHKKLVKVIDFKSMTTEQAKQWIKNIRKQRDIYLLSYNNELKE